MQVEDVMTKDVRVVFAETPFKVIAELIETHHVSALPVVDHRRPVGVVSEADLLLKAGHDPSQRRHWFLLGPSRAKERKAHAVCARDLMTAPAIVIGAEATVSEAADQMLRRHVKRLPVVDPSGKLVGIVSRSDLLKVFTRSDEEIKQEIESNVLQWTMLLPPGQVRVRVQDGVVMLEGQVDRRSDVSVLKRISSRVDGVVAVQSEVGYRWDDTRHALDLLAASSAGLVPPW